MKANGSKIKGAKTRRSNPKRGTGTDWEKLRRMSAARIRKGIAADPDEHATDAEFWKSAEVVLPKPKEIVTMRLDAETRVTE